ncbi:uncharacterized protein LOC127262735 [Andrographis paniculata]|uniref:uncharacterized protein LOC127262735 n=1 Tax=Andrographis paniculata TaxID=175694 RepID=UPI0021E7C829|nr:uncharacterized protein LOC127262735 [Andrographis paniculata]
MEGGSSASPPFDATNSTAASTGGASKFLANLPTRGLLSSAVISTNPGGMRVYICDHDTSPSDDQIIKTNQTNILIRSLMLKNQNGSCNSKDGKSNQGSRKRASEKSLEKAGKKAMSSTNHGTSQGGSSIAPDRDLQNLTVDRLRALLKERGLSVRGRKDELIARLRGASG